MRKTVLSKECSEKRNRRELTFTTDARQQENHTE